MIDNRMYSEKISKIRSSRKETTEKTSEETERSNSHNNGTGTEQEASYVGEDGHDDDNVYDDNNSTGIIQNEHYITSSVRSMNTVSDTRKIFQAVKWKRSQLQNTSTVGKPPENGIQTKPLMQTRLQNKSIKCEGQETRLCAYSTGTERHFASVPNGISGA
jgi:hypothetical protein